MELSNRPLLATRTDQRLYLSRPFSTDLVRAVRQGSNILLLGRRGSGKTTELHQLAAQLEVDDLTVVEVDGRLVRSVLDLLRLLLQRLGFGSEQQLGWDDGEVSEALGVFEAIGAGLGEQRAYILLDEPDPAVAHTLFGRLRDELWQRPMTWIVAGNEADEAAYLTPPADAFFERTFRIPDLAVHEVLELLDRRGIDSNELFSIESEGVQPASRTEVTPREAIELGRLSSDGPAAHEALRQQANKAYGMGRPYAMAYSELDALGPVSASDERLLNRLGWTRERATQVLRKLELAGIVESFIESRDKPGRPRKLYRIKRLHDG